MTAFILACLGTGLTGAVAGVLFFILWRLEVHRHANTVAAVRKVANRIERLTPEYRRPGAPVGRPLSGQTVVLAPTETVIRPRKRF